MLVKLFGRIALIAIMTCALKAQVRGQAAECGPFLETFDAPFGGASCAGVSTPTAQCHSKYSFSAGDNVWSGGPMAPGPFGNGSGSSPVGQYTVESHNGSNVLWTTETHIAVLIPSEPSPSPLNNILWRKTLTVPAGYGGSFSFDLYNAGFTAEQATEWSLAASVTGPNGVSVASRTNIGFDGRVTIAIPVQSHSQLTFTIELIQKLHCNTSSLPGVPVGQPQPAPSDCVLPAPPRIGLDNISFTSDAPEFLETFDAPFGGTSCAGVSTPTAQCHSKYSFSAGDNVWDEPAVGTGPVEVKYDKGLYRVEPHNGSNVLWTHEAYVASCERKPGVPPPAPHNNILWSKTLTVPAGYGGSFSFDLYNAGFTNEQLDEWWVEAYVTGPNGVAVASRLQQGFGGRVTIAIPVQPHSQLTFTIGLAQMRLCCQQRPPDYPADQPPPPGPATCAPPPPPRIGLDNIAIKYNGSFGPLSPPAVANVELCNPGRATFSVTNPLPEVRYHWFSDADGQNEIGRGPTYTTTVNAPLTLYVQTIPDGALGCPSRIVPVRAIFNPLPARPDLGPLAPVVLGNALEITFTGEPNVVYTWNWGDQTQPSSGTNIRHTYTEARDYTLMVVARNSRTGCESSYSYTISVVTQLCETVLALNELGQVQVQRNQRTGSYIFINTRCTTTQTIFDCITGQGQEREVVAASAISLANTPPVPDPAYNIAAADIEVNPFLTGASRLRPEATYAYSTAVNPSYTKSFEVGRYQMTPFNWQVSARHRLPAWQRAGLATRFSPNGEATEEQDILGVLSTVKLGYKAKALPYLTAKNAGYNQVLFEGFENMNASVLRGEDRFAVSATEAKLETTLAHSGAASLELNDNGSSGNKQFTLPSFTTHDFARPMQLKLWLRVSEAATPGKALSQTSVLSQATSNAPILFVRWSSGQETPMSVVGQSGEWMLCSTTSPISLTVGAVATTNYAPQIVCAAGSRRVWVDDVRLQPWDAQMTCYVYDPVTLKLLASFDDQHFGLYYQYNAEGKLVRKQIETERGLKTLQETQYNTPAP